MTLPFDHTHDLDLGVSRWESEIALSQEWGGGLTMNEKDVSHPLMTMILTCVTMVGWADVPDSDRGDFRRRRAVDISSSSHWGDDKFAGKWFIFSGTAVMPHGDCIFGKRIKKVWHTTYFVFYISHLFQNLIKTKLNSLWIEVRKKSLKTDWGLVLLIYIKCQLEIIRSLMI